MLKIVFITGTSGSGKSTLVEFLKQKLPVDQFAVYDFDENGVPDNADVAWRVKMTDFWLCKGQANGLLGKSTIICGVTVPSEILKSTIKLSFPIQFGFLKVSDKVIKERLRIRGWSDKLIEDNLNWAHYLEKEVRQCPGSLIIDCEVDQKKESILDRILRMFEQ